MPITREEYRKKYQNEMDTINQNYKNNLANNPSLFEEKKYNKNKGIIEKIADGEKHLLNEVKTGLIGGVTGLGTAGTTEVANNLNKGSKGNVLTNALNLFNAARKGFSLIPTPADYGKILAKNIQDKNSNILQKAVNTSLGLSSPENLSRKALQLYGSILPNNASDKVMRLGEKISEPYNNALEQVLQERSKQSKPIQYIGSALQSVGQMAPSIAATMITKNPNVGLATMGWSAKGNYTTEALKKGADLEKAVKIGDLKGQIEVGTEMLTGGVNIFGKGTLDNVAESWIKKSATQVGQKLKQMGYDLGGEVLEEVISDTLGTIIDKGTVDPDTNYTINDFSDTAITTILSTFMLNLLTGGLAGNTNMVNRKANNTINEQNISENINSINENFNNNKNIENINNEDNIIKNDASNTNGLVSSTQNTQLYNTNNTNNNQTANNNQVSVLQEQIEELNNKIQEDLSNEQPITIDNQELNTQELDNNSFNLKQSQLDIINKNNPALNDNNTWIRSVNDIKTFEEAFFENDEYIGMDPDFTKEMALKSLETGKIKVYSSYPIANGTFVSPSQMEASQYAGDDVSKLYSKVANIYDIAWIDGAAGQYAQVLPNQVKGNIPVNQELYKKYPSVKEMINNEIINYDGKINLNNPITELDNININEIKIAEAKQIAQDIFYKYNNGQKTFLNNNNAIFVGNEGINESVEKIFNNRRQRNLLKEHFQVFSDLGDIIEHAKLSNQADNIKKEKNPDVNYWNYYLDGLEINNNKYKLEFDVRSMDNGQNQYRVQRLELDTKKQVDYDGVASNARNLPPNSQPVSINDNTTNRAKSQNALLSNINYGENQKNNTINNENVADDVFTVKLDNKNNPLTIAALNKQNASTTPILPTRNVETGEGNSRFAKNIENKTDMLTPESKKSILSSDEVNYYKEVSNEESLNKAKERLDNGGETETLRWLSQDTSKSTSVDIAEGWILLKQFQDQIQNTTDTLTKDQLNRSMVEVAKHMRDIGTKAGQTVQAYNILNRLTPEGMVYYAQGELSEAFDTMSKNKTKEWIDNNRDKFELTPDETQFIMDTMEKVQSMEDGYDKKVELAKIQKIMSDKLPPAKGTGIKTWMRISMLFNPKTQVRNVAGNAMIVPVNAFSDLFASAADKIISKKTGVRTTGNMNLKNYLKGSKRGVYQATNDYRLGINTKDMRGNRFEINEGKSFNDTNIFGRTINKANDLLSYVMDVGDRVFSEGSFENSLQNQLLLNNTTEVTQDMIDIATQEALSRTWNDNNNYTRFVINVRSMLNKISANSYGLGDVLIPFAKTPANLTKAIVDYSPLGMVKAINDGINLKKSLTNGQYTSQMQHQFVQDLGKATAGSMLYILGYALAKAGITSGESDDDKDVANFLRNTLGISSYSIKIGNKTFTYDWAQPIAAPLSITANIAKKQKESASIFENIVSSLDTAGSILMEQSFMESIQTALSNNDGLATGIKEAILDLPARMIPTFVKQIADMVDSTKRTTFEYNQPLKSSINAVKSKIPGLNKALAPSVDTMGREIQKYGGKNNIFNVFLNPANVNTEKVSESAAEIYRLYKETGYKTIMPRVAPYYLNKKGEKIILTSEQKAKYQKVSGDMIEENIQILLKSKQYNSMSNADKADIVNNIVNYSYNVAQKEVLDLDISSTYSKAYTYDKIGNITDYYMLKSQDFTSDKDKDGKTISGSKKQKVVSYVNSMYLSATEKAILLKMNGYTIKDYDNDIINYINNKKLSVSDKTNILTTLGFTVKDGRVYS